MRTLLMALVQTINGSYAQDGWSTGVSTPADFAYFIAMRRRAGAIIIDRRTALNPAAPVINAPGKKLEHTPVYVFTESDEAALQAQLDAAGLDYRAQHFSRDDIAEVVAGLDANSETLLCESGPNLAYRLLDACPGAELHLSISPKYSNNPGSHFSRLQADIELRVEGVETRDDQVFVRYRKKQVTEVP